MPEIRIPILEPIPGTHVPAEVRDVAKRGFKVLARISPAKWRDIPEFLKHALDEGGVDVRKVSSGLDISEAEARELLTAASFLANFVFSAQRVSAEDAVKKAVESNVLDPSDQKEVLRFGEELVSQRASFMASLESSGLASRTLPSLTHFEASVDIRFAFDKGKVSAVVPVIVFHLDTDTEEQIWAQMTKGRLKTLIEQLQEALHEAEQAEAWATARLGS